MGKRNGYQEYTVKQIIKFLRKMIFDRKLRRNFTEQELLSTQENIPEKAEGGREKLLSRRSLDLLKVVLFVVT
jgi:hypothetical protein